jgi:hypothetical protein
LASPDDSIRSAVEAIVPLRAEERPDWERVLTTALTQQRAPRLLDVLERRPLRIAAVCAVVLLACAAPVLAIGASQGWFARSGGTVPSQILFPVHGRVIGWVKTGESWFAVYLGGKPAGRCGLDGSTWRLALVSGKPLPFHVTDDRRLTPAMCGNELSWVKSGRFSDGRHAEVAFMLWATPSLGATTYVYRVAGGRLTLLARFAGDRIVLSRGTVTVHFENPGRSRKGELEDVYRFRGGRYVLVRRGG